MKRFAAKYLTATALAAASLAAPAPSAHAYSFELMVAETLTPDTMFLGFIWPVTSQEFLSTLGIVVNAIPYFNEAYMPVEEWLPRARKWSINPPTPINPVWNVPPSYDATYVPTGFSQIIAFGDSMSDTGNLFKMTQEMTQVGLPVAPSYKGRFSNGVVALDVMANQMRLPLTNYSFSGAKTGRGNLLPFWSWQKGILFQIDEFHLTRAKKGQAQNDPNALYVVWAGPNDFIGGMNIYWTSTAKKAAANMQTAIRNLYQHGSRHFFVPVMPDPSLTPAAVAFSKSDNTYLANASKRADEYKVELLAVIERARAELPGINIRTFDTLTFLREEIVKAKAQGINTTDSCYQPRLVNGKVSPLVCADPDNYLFWDKNHPTDRASRILGTEFTKAAAQP